MRGVQLPAFIFLVSAYLIMRPTFTSGSITRMPVGCQHLVSGSRQDTGFSIIPLARPLPSGWSPMCSNVWPVFSYSAFNSCLPALKSLSQQGILYLLHHVTMHCLVTPYLSATDLKHVLFAKIILINSCLSGITLIPK